MKENQLNLDDLFTLDFLNLRLKTVADIEPHDKLKGRIELISSLCPHFHTKERIGLCDERQIICPAWECELIKLCKSTCIKNCLVVNPKATFYTELPDQMRAAIDKLTDKIEQIRRQVPDEAVVAWFSKLAEGSAQIALTKSPYELIEAIKIWQWLYETYGNLNSYNLEPRNFLSYEKQLDVIWRCMLAKFSFGKDMAIIRNGDALLALSAPGRKLLNQLEERPTYYIDKKISALNKAEKAKRLPPPEYDDQMLWTIQMVPVMRWCVTNTFPTSLIKMSIADQFREMENANLEAISKRKSLHLAEDIRLSLPLYGALFYMSRYAALNSSFFQEVIKDYQWLPDVLEKKLGLILDHRFWDKTLMQFKYMPELKTKIKLLRLESAQSERWPISSGSNILLANILLLGFAAKNKLNILANNYQVGNWFEDIIEKELYERRIPIVSRNLKIPGGEIDFICFDSTRFYVIEAKDYGPRGVDEYFSSKEYKDRNKDLEDYINKFRNRISWIKKNATSLDIPKDALIYGVYVSSCEEPHVKIPTGLVSTTNRRLCGIFGGEPIDPMVKLRAHKANLPRRKDSISFKKKGRLIPSRITPHSLTKLENKIIKLANRRIETIFGDIISFQLYRIAWEICKAFAECGVSIMELCAEPKDRPIKATKQYLFFVAHRADNLLLSDIKVAFRNLLDRGLLIEDGSQVRLGTSVPCEYWQLKRKKWNQIDSAEDADLILFDANVKKDKKLGKIASFVDAMGGNPKTLIMFKVTQEELETKAPSN